MKERYSVVITEETAKKYFNEVQKSPFVYEFLNDKIDNLYAVEKKTGRIFGYFTGLAIFIACLGLFGLASYTAEQRTKKVTKWVLMANVSAWPIAYIISNNWLQTFSYRVPIGVGVFLFSGGITFFIALLTVSYQAFKSATAHPVNSLRYE